MKKFAPTGAAAAVYALATIYISWPLAAHLGSAVVEPVPGGAGAWIRADFDLTAWIIAWVTHALTQAPRSLMDGNLFHPAENVLAGSENLLGVQPITAPIFLATGNAILAQNAAILTLVWLSALTTFTAVRAWTANTTAALLAGFLFAFAPRVSGEWVRIHWAAVSLLPLVTHLAWSAATSPRRRTLVALTAATSLQILAGIYVSYALAFWLIAMAPGLALAARARGANPLPCFIAISIAGLTAVPLAWPYLEHGVGKGLAPGVLSVVLKATSASPGAIAEDLLAQLGAVALGLAAVGAAGGRSPSRILRLSLAAAGLIGLALSLGVHLRWFHELLVATVPGFASIRGPARFIVLPTLAGALLAGIGAADIERWSRARFGARARLAVRAALVAAMLLVATDRAPNGGWNLAAAPFVTPDSAAYLWLAEHGQAAAADDDDERGEAGALLELPLHRSAVESSALRKTGRAMLGATRHWLPVLNGYTGHPPASARLTATLAMRLPDPQAFATLCSITDLRWLLVENGALPAPMRASWRTATKQLPIRWQKRFGQRNLYRVVAPCGDRVAVLRAELRGERDGRTLLDTPLAALPASSWQARIEASPPPRMTPFSQHWIPVQVHNMGSATWPGLTSQREGGVALRARWRLAGARAPRYNDAAVLLAADVAPGESLRLEVGALAPRVGEHVLEIGLVQEGQGWIDDSAPGRGTAVTFAVTSAPPEAATTQR